MENIYYEIRNAIVANVPEIKWIDLDEGQLEDFEHPPVDYPCLIVGFPQARYENMGECMQNADITISVKLGFKIWEKFNASVPISNQSAAFDHFGTIRKVVKALHGLTGDSRSELMRVSMSKHNRPDPKIYEISFECAFYDDTTLVAYETIQKPALELMQN